VSLLPGGVSSATVLVRLSDGRSMVLKSALPKLRTKVEWFSPVTRIHREAAGMRALANILPAGCVPGLIFEDHAEHLIAMTAVPEPHENFKEVLLAGRVEDDSIRQFALMLGQIHRAGIENSRSLSVEFADRSFFESLRLEPYYAYAARQMPEAQVFLTALIEQTRRRQISLVHGDYSPKNILIHDGKLVLLDHEVIHFGDPAFDVGFAMTHLLSKAHHLVVHRAQFRNAAGLFWDTYSTRLLSPSSGTPREGKDGGSRSASWQAGYESQCVHHVLGCLLARVAGRSQLEYLSDGQKSRQAKAVIELMTDPPDTMNELVDGFLARL
jgi:aminoglycoside phosphotransferase (APT) family kinase protein